MKNYLLFSALFLNVASAVTIDAIETHKTTVNGVEWTYMVKDGRAELGGGRRTVQAVSCDRAGELEVPASLAGHVVTAVGPYAFYDCKFLTSVTLPETITSLGKDAFSGAVSLETIRLPDSVESLGSGVFEECLSLTNVVLSANLDEIPESAFSFCESLESLAVPARVARIGADAFLECLSLKSVTFRGPPPAMDESGFLDLEQLPDIVCRSVYLGAYRAIAEDGQKVYTYDGAGLSPITEALEFGTVGFATRDRQTAVFENTSADDVIVTGYAFGGFSAVPVESFDEASATNGWRFYPATSWGVVNGRLSSRAVSASSPNFYYSLAPGVYSNVTVQADIVLKGTQDNAVGLALRAADDFTCEKGTGWRFQIAPSGSYMICYVVNDTVLTLQEWTETSAISPNGTNTLAVSVRGNTYNFFINGQRVWNGEYGYIPNPGRVGLFNYANGNTYLEADNLRIVEDTYLDRVVDDATTSFAIDADFPLTVKPGTRISVPVAFQPTRLGAQGAMIGLVSSLGRSDGIPVFGMGALDDLSVVSTPAVSFAGHLGGPFSPEQVTVVVSNAYRLAQSFRVETPAWLCVAPREVTLAAGATCRLVYTLTDAAKALPPARHNDVSTLHHQENGYALEVPVSLYCYTTARPVLGGETIVVTNVPGQVQTRTVTLTNDAASDGPLNVQLRASETDRHVDGEVLSTGRVRAAFAKAAAPAEIAADTEHAPARLLVRFNRERLRVRGVSTAERVRSLTGGAVVREFSLVEGLTLVELPQAPAGRAVSALRDAMNLLHASDEVLYVEPDYVVKAYVTPNDPKYGELWAMKNTGQTGGTPGADISAEAAWNVTTGSRDVIVAVIDTGIDYTHPDLKDNMWTNPGEIPGNGIDDDGNGYIDDVYGINAITMKGDPRDDNYHGTHCAGTIGGTGDNGVGVAGVCWKVRLMALKFLNSGGSGYSSDAIACIEYGIRHGAKVMSNSWGGGGYNQALKDAIDAADAAGVVFVAAAGNDSVNTDRSVNYPSCYDCDNIISVVASTPTDTKADFSNWGLETCDIAAPGKDIVSCSPNGSYRTLSGTSMATPHVAGACALLLSLDPYMTPAETKRILMTTGDEVPALATASASGRRLNVAAAVRSVGTWASPSPDAFSAIPPGESRSLTLGFDAGTMPPGVYDGLLRAFALDEEGRSDAREIRMVILPDDLVLSDTNDTSYVMHEGSPEETGPMSFEIANTGTHALDWQVSVSGCWMRVSETAGTLAGGEVRRVAIEIDNAESLLADTYEAEITLVNVRTQARYRRSVRLTVLPGMGPLYVDPASGDDRRHGRLPGEAVRSLSGALRRVTSGTEIRLADGVYGPVVMTDSKVSFTITGVNGCGKVIIDGGNTNRCCTFVADSSSTYSSLVTNVTVRGVTLMRGRAEGSGSATCGGAVAGGLYEDCRLVSSSASGYGGGAYRAFLRRCEISGNSSASLGGGAAYSTLEACTVAGNRVTTSGYSSGAGLYYGLARDSIVYGNATAGATNPSQGYSTTFDNSLSAEDPGYRDPEHGLYTLSARAPRSDIGCYPGIDTRDYFAVVVSGTGLVPIPYAHLDASGSATLTAYETTRRFVGWTDDSGELLGTNLTLVVTGLTNVVTGVATFAPYELYVDAASGDDTRTGTDESVSLASIERALALVEPGETIHVAPGVYGPINTKGRVVTIRGAGIGRSVIDGGATNRCASLGSTTNESLLVGFTLRNGRASNGGGASYGRLLACEIVDCVATNGYGGGSYYSRLESCIIARNAAWTYGGGSYYGALYNCSVLGNRLLTGTAGGGVYYSTVYNSVVQGNLDANAAASDLNVYTAYASKSGSSDFGLVDPRRGDARLKIGSSLLDAGTTAYGVPETDVLGRPRLSGEGPDIGAYEGADVEGLVVRTRVLGEGDVMPRTAIVSPGGSVSFTALETERAFLRFETNGVAVTTAKIFSLENVTSDLTVTAVFAHRDLFVNAAAEESGDGLSAASPLKDLDEAIAAARDGETIYVAPGVYPPVNTGLKRIHLVATGPRDRTIVDGSAAKRTATLGVTTTVGASMTGFTLRNGYHSSTGAGTCYGTLTNCVVTGNVTSNRTGYVYGGATYYTRLSGCVISNNLAFGSSASGGGSAYGVAEWCVYASNTVISISANSCQGGATYQTTTYDSLMVGNLAEVRYQSTSARGYGGAAYGGSHYGLTATDNEARSPSPSLGGGVHSANLYNAIVWNNRSSDDCQVIGGYTRCVHTDDPYFVDAAGGDFRLSPLSPCLGAGDRAYVFRATDLLGQPRVVDESVDLGCCQGCADGVYVGVRIRGTGRVVASVVRVGGDRSATVVAEETCRPFLRWTDADGKTLSTDKALTLTNVTENRLLCAEFRAYEHYVDAAAPASGDGHSPETALPSMGRALEQAADGETIYVAPGVYPPIDTGYRRVHFVATGSPEETVLDGGQTNRVATLGTSSDVSSSMTGFTLRGGYHSTYGAGAYYGVLTNCLVTGNVTSNRSGYAYGGGACYTRLVNCTLADNLVVAPNAYGGGSYGGISYNCLMVGNVAEAAAASSSLSAYGGGASSGTHYGLTATENETRAPVSAYGAGVYSATLYNAIVANNRSVDGRQVVNCNSRSVYEGDPLFVAADSGDYRLSPFSPCLGAGDPQYAAGETDRLGRPRVVDGKVDLGCYQGAAESICVLARVRGTGRVRSVVVRVGPDGSATLLAEETTREFLRWEDELGNVLGFGRELVLENVVANRVVEAVFASLDHYVAETGDDANDGLSSETPFATIGAAVAAAEPGETIFVGPGVYPPFDTQGLAVTIRGAGIGQSVIDGGATNRCASLGTSTNGTFLVGFTLRNGRAATGGGASYGRLLACEIVDCVATNGNGGGVYSSRLESCLVARNCSSSYGGGAYNATGYGCTLLANETRSTYAYSGAGVYGGSWYNSLAQFNRYTSGTIQDFYNCSTYGCRSGTNDVGLVDAARGDARLRPGSPLIDGGSRTYWQPETDIQGLPRVQGLSVDVGAYEGAQYDARPQTPTDLTASVDAHGGAIHVSWSCATNRLNYIRLLRATSADGLDAMTLAYPSGTNYVDSAVETETDYYYAISAGNNMGETGLTPFVRGRALKNLSIVTTEIPKARAGEPYTFTLSAEGGVEPYAWRVMENGYFLSNYPVAHPTDGTKVWSGDIDDGTVALTLPFAFRFYSTTYEQVYVNSNGALLFGGPDTAILSTTDRVKGLKCICALGRDLRLSEIQTKTTANAFSIRCTGVYYSDRSKKTDYAFTLFRNGRIALTYGEGNASGGIVGVSDGRSESVLIVNDGSRQESPGESVVFDDVFFPEGLALSEDGQIAGTPTDGFRHSVGLSVTDAEGARVTVYLPFEIAHIVTTVEVEGVPVPLAWLDSFALVSGGYTTTDYREAALMTGENGYKTWESYVAGLDPTDPNSQFRVAIEIVDGKPVVSWTPDSPELRATRTYRTLGAATLDGEMRDISTLSEAEREKLRFFRVVVDTCH